MTVILFSVLILLLLINVVIVFQIGQREQTHKENMKKYSELKEKIKNQINGNEYEEYL